MDREEYEKLCQKASTTLEGLGHLLGKLVEAPPDLQCADGQPLGLSTAQLRQDAEIDAWYKTYYNLKDRLAKNEFSVAILALTKSGKSTLLNAIIGDSLLPVSNAPETARITSISHVRDTDVNTAPRLTYTDEDGITRTTVGANEIRSKLLFLNKEVRARRHVHSDEGVLDLAVPLVALNSWGSDKIALRLLDTPGPNEAGEEDLRHEVERLLDTVDAVIYLLDYTKLKTQEEATLLQRLKEINPQLVQRLSQRLFFVVNKADVMHTAEGMKEDETREYVAELVTRTLQQEGFRLEPEQVLLVSAHDALLSRLQISGCASAQEHERFLKLQFGRQAKSKTRFECLEAAHDMFQSSGVDKMEDEVFGFLLRNTGVLKVLATVDNICRVLAQVANVAAASSAALQQDVDVLQGESERLSRELNQVLSEFGAVQTDAEQVQGEVIELVRFRMQTLKETLFDRINAVLSLVQSETPSPAISGRWMGVYRKFISFFGNSESGTTEAGEVQRKLRELHEEIKGQLDAEVREFWYQLELATNQHQYALVGRVNKQLERLSRSIEAVVGEILDVRLEAVNLKIEPPTAGEFHESLNQLFQEGIGRKTETKSRTTEERVPVWTKQHYGLCRWGYYYRGEETVRSVTKLYTETTYEMKPDKIREYFINMVDQRVETSVRYVKRFVEDYMAARIDSARERVVEYGHRYSDAMLSALATSKQGEEARLSALASVKANLATLQGLQAACKAIEVEAAQKFPEAIAGAGRDEGWATVDWENTAGEAGDEDMSDGDLVAPPLLQDKEGSPASAAPEAGPGEARLTERDLFESECRLHETLLQKVLMEQRVAAVFESQIRARHDALANRDSGSVATQQNLEQNGPGFAVAGTSPASGGVAFPGLQDKEDGPGWRVVSRSPADYLEESSDEDDEEDGETEPDDDTDSDGEDPSDTSDEEDEEGGLGGAGSNRQSGDDSSDEDSSDEDDTESEEDGEGFRRSQVEKQDGCGRYGLTFSRPGSRPGAREAKEEARARLFSATLAEAMPEVMPPEPVGEIVRRQAELFRLQSMRERWESEAGRDEMQLPAVNEVECEAEREVMQPNAEHDIIQSEAVLREVVQPEAVRVIVQTEAVPAPRVIVPFDRTAFEERIEEALVALGGSIPAGGSSGRGEEVSDGDDGENPGDVSEEESSEADESGGDVEDPGVASDAEGPEGDSSGDESGDASDDEEGADGSDGLPDACESVDQERTILSTMNKIFRSLMGGEASDAQRGVEQALSSIPSPRWVNADIDSDDEEVPPCLTDADTNCDDEDEEGNDEEPPPPPPKQEEDGDLVLPPSPGLTESEHDGEEGPEGMESGDASPTSPLDDVELADGGLLSILDMLAALDRMPNGGDASQTQRGPEASSCLPGMLSQSYDEEEEEDEDNGQELAEEKQDLELEQWAPEQPSRLPGMLSQDFGGEEEEDENEEEEEEEENGDEEEEDLELEQLGFTEVPAQQGAEKEAPERIINPGMLTPWSLDHYVRGEELDLIIQRIAEGRTDVYETQEDPGAWDTSNPGSPWSHMSQEGSFSPSFSSYASPRGTPVSNSAPESCDVPPGELPVSSVPPPSLSDTEACEVQQEGQGAMRPNVPPPVRENAPAVLPAALLKSDYASGNEDGACSSNVSNVSDDGWDIVESQEAVPGQL